jgi:MFS family permease
LPTATTRAYAFDFVRLFGSWRGRPPFAAARGVAGTRAGSRSVARWRFVRISRRRAVARAAVDEAGPRLWDCRFRDLLRVRALAMRSDRARTPPASVSGAAPAPVCFPSRLIRWTHVNPRVTLATTFRALRYRNFRLFVGGQLVSLVGTWMQSVALSWLVYRLTGSAVLLGAVSFASQIPVFVLAPAGGVLADRVRRRSVLIVTQATAMLLAATLAAVTLLEGVSVWQIFVLGAALGVVNAFDIPARQAFVVEMVERADVMNAIALNSAMFNGARIVGPAVAGIMVASVGEGWCFFANAVSYLAVIAGLLRMRLPRAAAIPPAASIVAHLVEGVRFARLTAPIRVLLLLLGLVSLVAMPYTVLMPIFADRILGSGARGLGILMGATGTGALIGALLLATREDVRGLGRWVAIAMGGFGLALIAFALSRVFWLSTALLVLVGGCMMVQMSASNTLIQAMVPDALRGRVMALYSMMFMGLAPVGALLAGTLAERLGAPAMVAMGGVLACGGAAAFWMRLPALRPDARQLLLAQQAARAEHAEGRDTAA